MEVREFDSNFYVLNDSVSVRQTERVIDSNAYMSFTPTDLHV